jgi:hypothetical protein
MCTHTGDASAGVQACAHALVRHRNAFEARASMQHVCTCSCYEHSQRYKDFKLALLYCEADALQCAQCHIGHNISDVLATALLMQLTICLAYS